MVFVKGGAFIFGRNDGYPEEAYESTVTLPDFWIDKYEVTNRQYEAFVEATGYVTVAERAPNPEDYPGIDPSLLMPGSAVFRAPDAVNGDQFLQWWSFVPGADWRHPAGPESSIHGKEDYPVVHIAYEDAKAYADWMGRDLPTEAQWEYAARNQQRNEAEQPVDEAGRYQANFWQGVFPVMNNADDGFEGLAPVGCYAPNPQGAYDMVGNVWEWTGDWYRPGHDNIDRTAPAGPLKSDSYDPNNPDTISRVIKGGSYLCARNYCQRYRPEARHAQDTGLGTSHIGFRTVVNE
ncbi:formylglycine-generating enzyme family protein [Parvularcula flava]|uniref:Formylglycine-generating enzyme family protein n=1 Tax=Aquisalinus luteolus TaxID=1566827 RepID=A0A8J3A1P2_9PROT|nr:formylglycine-generating enzyme family protein [Aquisalinus luteolus]NHK26410.1 formylglycine-generating enzyme family protein [Aquisalinus luteolus]GGH92253.1 hypothetical protein GCM10011355_01310 [Aquisalinus luteolus]